MTASTLAISSDAGALEAGFGVPSPRGSMIDVCLALGWLRVLAALRFACV